MDSVRTEVGEEKEREMERERERKKEDTSTGEKRPGDDRRGRLNRKREGMGVRHTLPSHPKHTHASTYTLKHTQTHTHSSMYTHTAMHLHMQTHTHTRTHTHPLTLARMHLLCTTSGIAGTTQLQVYLGERCNQPHHSCCSALEFNTTTQHMYCTNTLVSVLLVS